MNEQLEQQILAQGIDKLSDVQAGHLVMVSTGLYSAATIGTVDRVTKMQIIIGNKRYSREFGHELGSTNYNSRIRIGTTSVLLEAKVWHAKRDLRMLAERVNQEIGILTGNASVTESTLDRLNHAYNQLSAVLATLGGGK